MMKKCKRCLLIEAGESVTYKEITDYISSLDKAELADEKTARNRLEICKKCDNLISGTCLKCGCYVEIRARLKKSVCPDDIERW